MRTTFSVAITILISVAVFNTALACDTCGCSDKLIQAVENTDSTVPESHPVDLIEGLEIELITMDEIHVAYMEGTVLGDMNQLFGAVMAAANEQGLFTADFHIGSMYPDDMSQGIDDTTRVFCGLTIAADAEVVEPLKTGTVPAGMYLQIEHIGDYALLEDTYTRIYTWAGENGVIFTPPSYEVYLTNPETTPVEEWLTYIYLPFDHEAMKEAFKDSMEDHPQGGVHDGHAGHDHGHEGHGH